MVNDIKLDCLVLSFEAVWVYKQKYYSILTHTSQGHEIS